MDDPYDPYDLNDVNNAFGPARVTIDFLEYNYLKCRISELESSHQEAVLDLYRGIFTGLDDYLSRLPEFSMEKLISSTLEEMKLEAKPGDALIVSAEVVQDEDQVFRRLNITFEKDGKRYNCAG